MSERLADVTEVHRVEYDRTGGPEVLEWRAAPIAPPGAGEVRVAVHAASVNPIDGKIRAGLLPPLPFAFPASTGRDGMGRVVALGEGVEAEWLGRRVAFLAPRGGAGTWAEAVNMPVAVLTQVPLSVGDMAAAALPLVGLSAATVLACGGIRAGETAAGKRVLVHAAAGGVGRIVVQLARLAGAEVHATASAANRPVLERLGAARVWARDEGDFSALRDVDLVVDLLGGAIHDRSYPTLRQGGMIVCLIAAPFTDRSAEFGVKVAIAEVAPDQQMLAQLLDLVATGRLDPGPAHVLHLRDFAEAQRRSDSGHLSGKLVLDLQA